MGQGSGIAQSALYRAVWRWHFYAGLLVLPFLVLLAVTGGIYLFKPELEQVIYRPMIEVASRDTPAAPVSYVAAMTEWQMGGRVEQITLPERGDRSVKLLVRLSDGTPRSAYADPYDGRLLGSTEAGGIMQFIRKIHSLQQFGFWASSLIEIAAGWAIVLVGTGLFLWWPRGRKGGVVTVRGNAGQRTFWRDTHAVTGVFAGAVIVFLAITGMPWSMYWGDNVQRWATAAHLSRPPPPAQTTPGWMLNAKMPDRGHAHHGHGAGEPAPALPWALQQAEAPASHHAHSEPTIGIDRAVARVEALGLPRPYSIQPPEGEGGAYVATYTPHRVEDQRTIYFDPHTGAVLGDERYASYGAAAKAIEWGIAVHQGEQYGWINRYLMLAGCIAIVLLAVSAATMWWMRRPKGAIGAPPAPNDNRAALGVLGIIAIAGVIFPLTGASMLAALALDWLLGLRAKPAA